VACYAGVCVRGVVRSVPRMRWVCISGLCRRASARFQLKSEPRRALQATLSDDCCLSRCRQHRHSYLYVSTRFSSQILPSTYYSCPVNTAIVFEYGGSIDNTVEEKSHVFSLMSMHCFPPVRDAGSKTVVAQNPTVLNWGCWLTQIELCNCFKKVERAVLHLVSWR